MSLPVAHTRPTGVDPGTVVVTNKTFNVFLKQEHEIVSQTTLCITLQYFLFH